METQVQLDKETLEALGIAELPAQAQQQALASFYETLKTRFGIALRDKLGEAQLEAFNTVLESEDEDAIGAWLDEHVPDHADMFAEQLEALIIDLKALREDTEALRP